MHANKINAKLKAIVAPQHRKSLKKIINLLFNNYHFVRCFINKHFLLASLVDKTGKLHLGCGDIRLRGFLNVDYRALPTADIVQDSTNLIIFPTNTFTLVYANAFIEHVYRLKTQKALNEVYRVLTPEGIALFTCIPDFRAISQAYLQKKKGIVSDRFDLFEVYRYTHGDPEQYPQWWREQLHKSLFDWESLEKLLQKAGFRQYCIFSHCYRDEKLPISLSFAAWKGSGKKEITVPFIRSLLSSISSEINLKTIKIKKIFYK